MYGKKSISTQDTKYYLNMFHGTRSNIVSLIRIRGTAQPWVCLGTREGTVSKTLELLYKSE